MIKVHCCTFVSFRIF